MAIYAAPISQRGKTLWDMPVVIILHDKNIISQINVKNEIDVLSVCVHLLYT